MNFKKYKQKLGKVKNNACDMKNQAFDQVNQVLDEFQETLPALRDLGLSIQDLHVGMGAVMPEISAKVVGRLETVSGTKTRALIEQYAEKKLVVTLLNSLNTALSIQEKLGDLDFKGIEADIKLGVPPKFNVNFI
jgi:hypothetical protein